MNAMFPEMNSKSKARLVSAGGNLQALSGDDVVYFAHPAFGGL